MAWSELSEDRLSAMWTAANQRGEEGVRIREHRPEGVVEGRGEYIGNGGFAAICLRWSEVEAGDKRTTTFSFANWDATLEDDGKRIVLTRLRPNDPHSFDQPWPTADKCEIVFG
jgi:hypothetical protein